MRQVEPKERPEMIEFLYGLGFLAMTLGPALLATEAMRQSALHPDD